MLVGITVGMMYPKESGIATVKSLLKLPDFSLSVRPIDRYFDVKPLPGLSNKMHVKNLDNSVDVDARSQPLADAPRAMVTGGESQVFPAFVE